MNQSGPEPRKIPRRPDGPARSNTAARKMRRTGLPSVFAQAGCFGALCIAFFPLLGFRGRIALPVLGAGFIATALRNRSGFERAGWRDYAVALDPYLIVSLVSAAGMIFLGVQSGWLWVTLGLLTLVSLQATALVRFGREAWDIFVESGVAVAAFMLSLWAFIWGNESQPLDVVLAYVGLSLSLFGLLIFIWCASTDPDIRSISSALLALSLVCAALQGMLAFRIATEASIAAEWRNWLGVLTICLAGTGASHVSARGLRSTAVRVLKVSAARRSFMTLLCVVVGPVLTIGTVFGDWPVNLAFIAAASGFLSIIVCAHVFNLMRRWGALEHKVVHDSLTGLPNRASFHTMLDKALNAARVRKSSVAVMFLDLDRFKNVNDSLGHAAGNEMLIETGKRLRRTLASTAVVARIGGDEFAILLPETAGPAVSKDEANKLLAAFGKPFRIGRREIYVTPSIGVSHYPRDGADPDVLLQRADMAMYRAKEKGRNAVELFSSDNTSSGSVARLDIESALHSAVKDNQLQLFFQPKINAKEGHVYSVEALVRWRHPVLGVIGPDQFIPIAEETGLIYEIGQWALIEGCRQAKLWYDQGYVVPVAVNLSPKQFEHQNVPEIVRDVMQLTQIPTGLLELELTESLALQDPDRVASILLELQRMGVRRSIDDFGVGYSGLSYLNNFAFDAIKIDRKFVQSIGESGAPIIDAIIAMGEGLNLEVIAEGVENAAQVKYLTDKGCFIMQGYYYSPPLSVADFDEKFLKQARRRPKDRPARERRDAPTAPGRPPRSTLLRK